MKKLLTKIKQALCSHDYDYWGHEELYTSVGNEYHGIKTPTHTFICCKCRHQIIIRDRRK